MDDSISRKPGDRMIPLHEQYRPATFADVVGQDKAIQRFRTVAKRGIGGRCFWITGKSGTGKTTIARLIARELASEFCIVEVDALDLTLDFIREAEEIMQQYGYGGDLCGRVWIIEESHRLRPQVVTRLLTTMEALPDHVAFVFTTTVEGNTLFEDDFDAHPFLSRCVKLPLAQRDLAKAFAEHVRGIASKEGLNGRPIADYVKLVNKHGGNMRAVLTDVESGGMA